MKDNLQICRHIADAIHKDLSRKPTLDLALLGSDFGKVVYLLYAAKNGLYDEDSAYHFLDRSLSSFRAGNLYPTYCSGIAGFFQGMELLEEDGLIEGFYESARQCDPHLCTSLSYYSQDNFDFLHGAVGIAMYMTRHIDESPLFHKHIVILVDNLMKKAIKAAKGKKLLFADRSKKMRSNLSLSHGLAAVIVLLCRIYKSTKDEALKEKCRSLATDFYDYLISQLVDFDSIGSYTPSEPLDVSPTPRKSRLGWCYGDIGTVIALRAYSAAFGNPGGSRLAQQITQSILTSRLDARDNFIWDAGLCHGATGVFQFIKTCPDSEEKDKALDYWEKVRSQLLLEKNNHLYYGQFIHGQGIVPSLNMLEGDAGIGLSLMNENRFINKSLLYEE